MNGLLKGFGFALGFGFLFFIWDSGLYQRLKESTKPVKPTAQEQLQQVRKSVIAKRAERKKGRSINRKVDYLHDLRMLIFIEGRDKRDDYPYIGLAAKNHFERFPEESYHSMWVTGSLILYKTQTRMRRREHGMFGIKGIIDLAKEEPDNWEEALVVADEVLTGKVSKETLPLLQGVLCNIDTVNRAPGVGSYIHLRGSEYAHKKTRRLLMESFGIPVVNAPGGTELFCSKR